MNRRVLFNDGWEFAKSSLNETDWTHLAFAPVDIPHDWLIADALHLYENSIGWYRKHVSCTRKDKEEKKMLLSFDGVYMDSTVYINGQPIGEHKYGYSSFEHDITPALQEGDNEITVKVVYQSPNSRWYSGAGIFRNVWLKTRGRQYIVTDGVYISTRQTTDGWQVEVDTELCSDEELVISHRLLYENEVIAAVCCQADSGSESHSVNRQMLRVEHPMLWSTEHPHLYCLITTILLAATGEEIETVSHHVGFRHIELDPEQGLLINGNKMKLNGVCEHHDLGALGAAFNLAALRRRFHMLKEMGVNAIRTAHNMPSSEFMDLADEMGFLIVSEAFDMWERPKTSFDYARFFKDWAAFDVRSWVMRDRNHPSLLLWSIGNEIYDTHADERGQDTTRMLMEYVQRYDPKGNARITIGSNYMPWENAQKCADIVKVAGYNYAEKYYRKHHEEHPDWVIYGSETSSIVQSRGVYHFPFEQSILADDDEQCSALGNSPTSWGAKSTEACLISERDASFSLGQFIWTGFDYIGEPTPYHTKNSYFGQIDTATFQKDSYYIYQAEWTDYKSRPMVHVFPYWDFNGGQMIDVRVCSNAPRIELQLNGERVGVHEIDHSQGKQLVGWWKIPYREGMLTAIAYNEDGQVIATDSRESFGDARRIRLTPDKEQLAADGRDLIFLEIGMDDEAGRPVENANNRVHVEVTGAGRLLGLDNGDSTDYDSYKGVSRRLFSGKAMAIIGSTLETGKIRVRISSPGMEVQTVEFEALPVDPACIEGVSASEGNQPLPCIMGTHDEIPVRKMEIISDGGQHFHETRREMRVRVQLHPANTSYPDVEWSVVDSAGIESNIAIVDPDGQEAKVTALGDGEFRLRCSSRNGTDRTKILSQLEFKVSGIGTAYLNPYGFISAGLYDYSKGEVGNGNERGVATSRDGETQVGFHQIDFDPYGSDTITIPIFALSSEVYALQIWEGMPGEAQSQLLADVTYQKPSVWNTYQEETYRLSKRLQGVTSICFVAHQKVHIKGFSFERQSRAFERNLAAGADRIYGDAFSITDHSVEGIGNNVSLEFDLMDFGEEGASKLSIYGHSPLDKNTIHIRLENQDGEESQQLIEFMRSDGYEGRVFPLTRVMGTQKVTFIFLPGSCFNFGWFRFEA
ncbi:sugar-binding domain-containing protein [Paenibacillus chibensis]|uniref:sugar-binding domain-containing protein n=1 Tax=Paenibacillus chibensis TaxID=59846 RepID=UPI000FDCA1B6|nr:sugar-binding domain-containing protein [Paenibacillus chibensis]MEC0369650.1 glycoside hydrolase family 2 TIM barrel-domain containing protein [Paenibacillus chibensis]